MHEYHPELLNRRGEWIAWGLALVITLVWLVLVLSGNRVPIPVYIMAAFFWFAALSISLGNWMDRRTVIRITDQGIEYHNGLRQTQLNWDHILEVQVFPFKWGDKIRVIGSGQQFAFRTLGEVHYQGELKGQTGFRDGRKILEHIIRMSQLRSQKPTSGQQPRYYTRQ